MKNQEEYYLEHYCQKCGYFYSREPFDCPRCRESAAPHGSDFTVALQTEYDHVMVALGMACRKSGGDLTAPDVVTLMVKADALDSVLKLWGVNPNNKEMKPCHPSP